MKPGSQILLCGRAAMTIASAATVPAPRLRMRRIGKRFPGVQALADVDLALAAGEVLAIVGENGAGKSTLIKILAGAHDPDAGVVEISGQPVRIGSPLVAQQRGIAVIHQEFNLIPGLSVRENLFLGQERVRFGLINVAQELQRARELFKRLGVALDPGRLCRNLTVAQQQVVEIAKALAVQAGILVMDEPTAALSPQETQTLFTVTRELKSQGMGIIYVSHRLDEIFTIADRVLVLRDGRRIATKPIAELSRASLIEMMVGRSIDQEFPKQQIEIGEERLAVRGLCRGNSVRNVSFSIRRGEILGLTGLIGSGRTETARLMFGADRATAGTVSLDGCQLKLGNPRRAIASGLCLIPEDRTRQGLVLGRSALENFGLPNLKLFAPGGWIRVGSERRAFAGFVDQLRIRMAHANQRTSELSGGNQQKIVLSKWLQRRAEVIIFDEPTRGIDVGAKYEIYQLMNQLAAAGKAILMISSELSEVLGMADRILVMHDGRITGEITDVAAATQDQIMELAVR